MAEESTRKWSDQYMLRFPDGMRDRIKAAANKNGRSMNAEIISSLEEKYPGVRYQEFGHLLKIHREAKLLSKSETAKLAGLPLSDYLLFERGVSLPDLRVFTQISEVLDLPFEKTLQTLSNIARLSDD